MAKVNLPVAVLIWLMIIPMLLKIDFGALRQVKEHWRGIGVTLFINWAVKPFSMALLGWLFIGWLFAPWLPADQIDMLHRRPDPAGRRALHGHGVRLEQPVGRRAALHALARWRSTTRSWCSPSRRSSALLLGLSAITVPWETLLLSVVLYIVVPVIVAQLWRRALLASGGPAALDARCSARLQPVSLVGAARDAGAAVRLPGRADPARSRWSSRCWRCRS